MVAVEDLTDAGEGHVGDLTDQVDGNVSCLCNVLGAALADDVLFLDAVFFVHGNKDLIHSHVHGLSTAQKLVNTAACRFHGDHLAVHKANGAELAYRALDLSDIGAQVFGKKFQHLLRDLNAHLLCLVFDNGNAQLRVGRLNIGNQTPFKAGLESILQGLNVSGRLVRGQNDLLAVLMQRVEGVEEFLLRGDLTCNELNVVDHENIAIAVFVAEFVHAASGHAFDHLIGEILALDVNDLDVGSLSLKLVGNGVKQVRFAKTRGSVDKQGIVIGCGVVCHGNAGCVCKLVGASNNEVVKGIFKFKGGLGRANLKLGQCRLQALGLHGVKRLSACLRLLFLLDCACKAVAQILNAFGISRKDQLDLDVHTQIFRELLLDLG